MKNSVSLLSLVLLASLAAAACDSTSFSSSSKGNRSAAKKADPGQPAADDKDGGDDKGPGGSDAEAPGDPLQVDPLEDVANDGKSKTPDGFGSDGFFGGAGGGDAGGGESDTGGDTNALGQLDEGGDSAPVKAPRFAMLVNDLKCGMCHTKINGDVASTSDVSDWSPTHVPMSAESVSGGWYAAKSWTDSAGLGRYNISVALGVTQNYVGKMVPNEPGTKTPAFPRIDFTAAEARMSGALSGKDASGKAVKVDKVASGNVVLIGTAQEPITIEGSVMIKGDLVLKGQYKGLGSVYVTGNIYIPANLVATSSVFPYPEGRDAALQKGRELVKARKGDALGLATAKHVFIADLATGIYDNPLTPAGQQRGANGIDDVYSWYPGGKSGYEALYEASLNCHAGGMEALKSFNLIEAYLYAVGSIGGIARKGSWMINGGVITDVLHVLGTVAPIGLIGGCPATASSVHGMPQDSNYINYDYRMSAGMRILGELAPYFN